MLVVCIIVPCIFVFFPQYVYSFNFGVCWGFSKVSAKCQESRYFENVSVSWYNLEVSYPTLQSPPFIYYSCVMQPCSVPATYTPTGRGVGDVPAICPHVVTKDSCGSVHAATVSIAAASVPVDDGLLLLLLTMGSSLLIRSRSSQAPPLYQSINQTNKHFLGGLSSGTTARSTWDSQLMFSKYM